jgi:hypothetical protein
MHSLPDPANRPSGSPDRDVTAAAWNAVAVASLAFQTEAAILSTILSTARGHGLTIDDLRHASGLDAAFIERLLAEHEVGVEVSE